jgi:hypothetical protein
MHVPQNLVKCLIISVNEKQLKLRIHSTDPKFILFKRNKMTSLHSTHPNFILFKRNKITSSPLVKFFFARSIHSSKMRKY